MLRTKFFLGSELTPTSLVFAGSSISVAGGYTSRVQTYAIQHYMNRVFSVQNAAQSGMGVWNNLWRAPTDIIPYDPDVLIWDNTNTFDDEHGQKAMDAFVRRLWTQRLSRKMATILFPRLATYTDAAIATPVNADQMQRTRTICDYYGIPYVDFDAEVRRLVMEEGHSITEYLGDVVHPNAGGQQLAAEMVKPVLDRFLTQGGSYSDLPPALYDVDGDYQHEPQFWNGTDYASRTGTWTNDGTDTGSSQVGATITFTGTFASFGVEAPAGHTNPNIAYTLDGVDYAQTAVNANGLNAGARGVHTVKLTVTSGTYRIKRFVAI